MPKTEPSWHSAVQSAGASCPGLTLNRTVLIVVLFVASLVHADGPVLHEYIPNASDDELAAFVRGANGEPEGIVYEGEILDRPQGGELRDDEQALSGLPGNGQGREEPGRRSPSFRPDRVTALEGTLGYFAVFNPTITPFKRVTALDAIVQADGGVPVLGVAEPARRVIGVEGPDVPAPDARPRDQFWGNVVLDFSAGSAVPLPSVSPESRVLSLRTEPEVALRIEKDAADNFFAVAPNHVRSQVRVIFLMDAPQSYFAAPIPDVPANIRAGEVFPLDDTVKRDALLFARELGLSEGSSLRDVLETLTRHFRSFVESQQPPPSTGNIYLDLSRGMKGVCRHRAYGFVITAQALGVPTRFVQNEAHAWVEAHLPDGWLRIDLGGAASALRAHGANDRPVYESDEPDSLPRPAAYREGYSQLAGDVSGLREESNDASGSSGDSVVGANTDASGQGQPGEPSEPTGDPLTDLLGAEPLVSEAPAARPVRLRLDRDQHSVFRGRSLTITGAALDPDGSGAEGLRVEVLLRDHRERLLGVTATREHGHFRAVVGVPPDLDVGDYQLIVRTPGNDRFFPATAR